MTGKSYMLLRSLVVPHSLGIVPFT